MAMLCPEGIVGLERANSCMEGNADNYRGVQPVVDVRDAIGNRQIRQVATVAWKGRVVLRNVVKLAHSIEGVHEGATYGSTVTSIEIDLARNEIGAAFETGKIE
jgi:hypothetical protein